MARGKPTGTTSRVALRLSHYGSRMLRTDRRAAPAMHMLNAIGFE